MTNSADTGRVIERGSGLKMVMETMEIPTGYRSYRGRGLPQRPGEKSLRVIERNLPGQAVGDGVEGVIRPRHLEQHRCGAGALQLAVESAAEPRQDDVITQPVNEQRRRNARAHVGNGRRLAVLNG